MKKIKLSIIIFGVVMLFSWNYVSADGFVISLYFDEAADFLSFDKSVAKGVLRDQNAQTSIVEFAKDQSTGPYILKLYDASGIEISSSEFNVKDGSFKLIIPYFNLASRMDIIKKSTNEKILSEDVSEYMICNGNGKCDKGENRSNCLGDCSSISSIGSIFGEKETKDLSDQNIKIKSEDNKSVWVRVVDFFKSLF